MGLPAHTIDTEADLLQKTAEGDHEAFRVLYNRYAPKVHAFALYILHDHAIAEEVMQEVMLKIWRLGNRLAAIDHLEAYLKTTSRNYCYNLLRRNVLERKIQSELAIDWDEGSDETEELVLLNEARHSLQEAVDQLPEYLKRVFQLCHLEGLKYEEAAQQLQLSSHSVRTYMKHALRDIRRHLRERADLAILIVIFNLF